MLVRLNAYTYIFISFAGGYENREKGREREREERNYRHKENCKYYKRFWSSVVIIEHRKAKKK